VSRRAATSPSIPEARFVELPGADHFVGVDPDQILDVVEPFLAECGAASTRTGDDRLLATLVAAEVEGHGEIVRAEFARHRGREVATEGRALVANFDGPARAVRCASAIREAARALGVTARAGVHTAEVEIADGRARGIAVDVAVGIAAQAAPGEVLVSQIVKDLVAGSGLEFADRGSQALSNVSGEWRLLAVADVAEAAATS
jgi:class 3 adenylate cyclase